MWLWFRAVTAYTICGLVTAAMVGVLLGLGGTLIHIDSWIPVAVVAASAVLIARELLSLTFRLPQVRRQTHKSWAMEYGIVTAAGMWGAHIGLGFATVIQHGGLFAVALMASSAGSVQGAVLLMFFWLGRTLPLWLVALLPLSSSDGPDVTDALLRDQRAYRYTANVGLVCIGMSAIYTWLER